MRVVEAGALRQAAGSPPCYEFGGDVVVRRLREDSRLAVRGRAVGDGLRSVELDDPPADIFC